MFGILRDDPQRLQSHEDTLFTLLYDVSDFMHQQLDIMKQESYQPADPSFFIKRIEELTGVPIDIISTGPDRTETMILRDPFDA